ncbi:MAG TPA: dynamin family protein [Chthoniobacterales bacterium]|jgi:small GTP-binding protein|nr:dynamin family protein [Chthoniobacterales bacterium]
MIADRYLQLKGELERVLAGLIELASEMQRSAEQLNTLKALLRDITDPLLFVVVGEVKSGKSSLLNALFGNEFAKVDVLPATDRVYIFRYGPEDKTHEVSTKLTERFLPIPFLRDFNVVDTPGTNTMVKEHQMVAEDFMPRADIVLFVFSVANPWTQSNWDFLDFLQKTWLKNVIFVLQQIDLREPTEIDVIHRHLQDTAMRRLGFVPPIFAVSARKALLSRTSGLDKETLWEESAFEHLEDQINFIVTESSARMLKLRSTYQAARAALEDVQREVEDHIGKISADLTVLERLQALLATRREQMLRQVGSLVREVERVYDESARERAQLLRRQLSWWRSFKLIFKADAGQEELEKQIETQLRQLMQPQMEKAIRTLETDLRALWPQMQDLLENQLSSDLRKDARQSLPDFAGQRRELSESIQAAFIDILTGKSLHEKLGQCFARTSILLRISVSLLVIAAALGAFLQAQNIRLIFFAVAGAAALSTIVLALNHQRKVLRTCEQQLTPKRTEFAQRLEQEFAKAIDSFCAQMANKIRTLSETCQDRLRRYQPASERAKEFESTLTQLKARVG